MNKISERTETGKKRGRPGRSPAASKLPKVQSDDFINTQQQEQTPETANEGNDTSSDTTKTMSGCDSAVAGPSSDKSEMTIKTSFTKDVIQVQTQNRFAPLDKLPGGNDVPNEDGEVTNQSNNNAKKSKPPPIVIHGIPTSHKDFIQELNQGIKKGFHIKYTTKKTNLFIHDNAEYKKYVSALDDSGKEFHTFTGKDEKHHAFVLSGLTNDVTEEDIKQDIETRHDIRIINVFKMKNTRRTLFLVIMDQKATLKHIVQNVRYVYNTRISWERHHNAKRIIQCHRCQEWSHATSNCRARPTCLKCAGPHWTRECTIIEKNDENQKLIKCANCKENHTANSTNCPVYRAKIEQIERRKQSQAATLRNKTQKFIAAPQPATNPWSRCSPFKPTNVIQNAEVHQGYAHGEHTSIINNVTNTQQHSQAADGMFKLVSEFDELNKLINVDRMFAYVNELNYHLKQCKNELEKFITFNNFCKKYFSSSQCQP